ncbi:hypothetical protein D3C79_1021750 [compost metagenome]
MVWSVMAASMRAGSRFRVCGSISTNTGVRLFHSSEWAVATKEYGVVITSPLSPAACNAVISAWVPLQNSEMCSTPR